MNIKAFNKKNLTFADMIVPNDQFLIEELKMSRKAPRGKRIYTFKKDVDVEKGISDCAEIGTTKVNSLKKVGEVGVVVAALIATICFTSALALPGGFNQDPSTDTGMAVLSGNTFFVAFLVTDIIAFVFSIVPIILYFVLTMGNSSKSSMSLFNIAHVCMVISINWCPRDSINNRCYCRGNKCCCSSHSMVSLCGFLHLLCSCILCYCSN